MILGQNADTLALFSPAGLGFISLVLDFLGYSRFLLEPTGASLEFNSRL